MSRRIRPTSHLEGEELERRYQTAKEPHEHSWWQILWQLARGQTAIQIAETTGYSRYWIGQIARRYNHQGPAGMVNQSPTHSHRAPLLLSPEQLAELASVIRGPAPEGDVWLDRTVAAWISQQLGRPVRRTATPTGSHPFHHAVPLVAQTDQETTRPETRVR